MAFSRGRMEWSSGTIGEKRDSGHTEIQKQCVTFEEELEDILSVSFITFFTIISILASSADKSASIADDRCIIN